jgi:tetratricopeptide (TPR) repeat protein
MLWLARRIVFSLWFVAGVPCVCLLHGQTQGSLDELLEKAGAAQSSGNYADAAKLYARTTALSPATPELWANRGVMEYLAGQIDASTISLKHALRLNSTLFTPLLFLGKSYVQTGKPGTALPYLDHAHSLRPDDVEVLLTLGKAYADLNRHRQAGSYYGDAVRLALRNPSAWYGLGVASLEVIADDGHELTSSQPQSVWARALFADELLAQGRPLEAMDKYKAVLAAASPAQTATLARTLEWMQSHPELFPLPANSQEALRKLNQQLRSEQGGAVSAPCTSDAPILEGAACAYWAGDYERSAAQAGLQNPQSAEALYWSIKAHERIAVAALARFEDLAPQSATSFVMVGDLYRHERQPDSALVEYKKALAIDAHDSAALMGAVLADLATGELDEATAMDDAALADRPLDPQLNLLMAEILAAKNQYDRMNPYLAKCAGAAPELQSRVHFLLGRAASEKGNPQEAIRQFEIALPGDKDGSIHYQLSRLYKETGNLAEARKMMAEAQVLIQRRDDNAAIALREAAGTNP